MNERILILTRTQKDSESTMKLIRLSNLEPYICQDFADLVNSISQGAGALLIAKEILVTPNLEHLTKILSEQASWSDLPVVVLASAGDLTEGNAEAIKMLRMIRNTTVLERPVRVATLMSILESSIANRRRQYEVKRLFDELVKSRQEAERANQTKSAFLANMSHEIRTPLGIMLGFAEFAADKKAKPAERKNYLEAIQKNGRILLELVNDILDLAKVESGHVAIESIETSIQDILKDVIGSLDPVAAAKNVRIQYSMSEDFPIKVKTDPTRIRQIFLNIIGNAVKFTDKGSITCTATIKKQKNRGEVILTVTDTGLGISESQLKKLFQPFSQADSSMNRKFGGTGLGLVLSRKLAQALGGDLRILRTKIGQGSTFEFSFAVELIAHSQKSESTTIPISSHQDLAGMRVLLAEDSLDNQFIIARFLSQVGIKVEVADNGKEAIQKAVKNHYDAVLMDIQMPLMDGNEATLNLRRQGFATPIIALTANALKGDREKAMESGFDDYITKPVQRTALYESLGRFDRRH